VSIVKAGLDIHRAQITYDALELESGEVTTGKIAASPEAVGAWVARFSGAEVHVAFEACTGWFFLARALARAGAMPTWPRSPRRALQGRKRRAKTDRADARWLRRLLCEGRLPGAWIPPDHICWLRIDTRLHKTLSDEATA
jgi:transposase